jgi:TRAP-type C4-dicarboxylate transport system permease small subunit
MKNKLIYLLNRIEDSILIGVLLTMLLMAVLQIFLRNFFSSGIVWGDAMVRILVLWVGLLGAMVATRNNNHINIDIISRFLPENVKMVSNIIVEIFAAFVCSVMTWVSFNFVLMEMEYDIIAFASVPAWICESIIPIAFGVICLRYCILSITDIFQLIRLKNK